MAQQPISMEYLKQILQLKSDGVAIREIARRIGISRNSVRKYLSLLSTEENNSVTQDNEEFATAAYGDTLMHDTNRLQQLTSHFNYAQQELKKTGVTRQMLWQEYILQHPDGYVYSHYCYHLNEFYKNKDLAMHLEYIAGDLTMIDYAGKKLFYIEQTSGEQVFCDVFVSILPFSGLIFCEASRSQKTEDFACNINGMMKFYGGSTKTLLCDNMRTAVKKADRYEPVFTDICIQLSEHYETTFSATRPYSPRDKAMVERAVNIVYTSIYAPLRNEVFTSLDALNNAIRERLIYLNNKPYKKTPYSRYHFFETQEQKFLKPLPSQPFEQKKVVILTIQRNYHVQLTEDHRYYSVPYIHVGKKVKVSYDARTVEVYLEGHRIALHVRSTHGQAYITNHQHLPPHHQRMKEIKGWNREALLEHALRIGSYAHLATERMLQNSIYMEQNYKACFGMLMLCKNYGASRLNAACERAIQGTRVNYTMIKNILERGLDKQAVSTEPVIKIDHENIRGGDHYK